MEEVELKWGQQKAALWSKVWGGMHKAAMLGDLGLLKSGHVLSEPGILGSSLTAQAKVKLEIFFFINWIT